MKFYLAPMDNITDYLYRQIVWRHFPYWDKVYAPFIQPNEKPAIVPKEDYDICPGNNQGIPMVPQILTKDSKGFIRVGKILEDYGYSEINLNLGCPAKPVVSKEKGSAMLADTHFLNQFLADIFSHPWQAKITVKTRLGLTDNSCFENILEVFSQYPIDEIIIHPRFRSDFYNGEPRLEEFEKVFSSGTKYYSICYNGNIYTKEQAEDIIKSYPKLHSIMCGRGAIADPSLIRQLKGGTPMSKEEFKLFHDDLLSTYGNQNISERNLLHKMMEMWSYWIKVIKLDTETLSRLRGAKTISEYHRITSDFL